MAATAAMAALSSSIGSLAVASPSCSSSSSSSSVSPSVRTRLHCSFHGLRSGTPLFAAAAPDLQSTVALAVRAGRDGGAGCRGVVSMGPMEAGIGVMGTKMGMMTVFTENGKAVPVTVVGFHEGNIVTQVKTEATDGYSSVQVGYRRVRDRKLKKPEIGHLNKIGAIPMRHLQEFRLQSIDGFEPNQRLQLEEIFKVGDLVDVAGNSIGKGFQGGIKRHNFARGAMSHGSKSHRELGSVGAGTTPGRVYPGKKMPGRMGGTRVKVRKLEIIKIDTELRALLVKGAVPGKPGNLLRITPAKIVGKNIPLS